MMEQALIQWISDYRYCGIFFMLIFGVIGLPIPDEWLLVISGYLVFKNVLGLFPTLLITATGSACGLTISYALGKAYGDFVVHKYGRWLSIDDAKILRAQHWFQDLGCWVLIVGPFIPGMRNLVGYFSGASKLRLGTFMRFAYLGALISSTSFVTFGYLLGSHLNWNFSPLLLTAVALAAAFILSGLPFRIALRIGRKFLAAAATGADA